MDFAQYSTAALAGPSNPVPASAPAPAKTARRLKGDGLRVLEEFQRENPNVIPNRFQTQLLLDRIRNIPGYDYFKSSHLKKWFERRVKRVNSSEKASPEHYVSSLNAEALNYLTVLYQGQNNPPPDVLETWAKLLGRFGATRQDVIAWVAHRTQMVQGNGQRLPTPSDTTSPEPLASTMGPSFKADPSHSPILPSLSQNSEPLSPHIPYHDPQPLIDPTLQAILAGVTESLLKPLPLPTDVPKSTAEFNAMFAPFEQHMSVMMRRLSAP